MQTRKLMLMLVILTLGMLVAVGAAKQPNEQPGGHPPDRGHDNDFGGHYDWLNPGGITYHSYYPYYPMYSYPNYYYGNYWYSPIYYTYPSYYYSNPYYPYYHGVEMRPGEAEAEWLFNHGIGEPWVGGNPPYSH